ncbi:MAG: hypothetical protein QHJ34_15420 [bacterium]|jgi:hypothetical protein|nr:hypothetical protein [candidate division KSB1 bacterium]MDH7561592.1 hypothetical protein [bacterium]
MGEQQAHRGGQQRGALSGIVSGLVIIWLGIVFLLDRQGVLAPGVGWVWYFLFGLGVILLLEVIARHVLPQYRQRSGGRLVAAVALMAIGAWQITGLGEWWPLLLIAAGLVLIVSSFRLSEKA